MKKLLATLGLILSVLFLTNALLSIPIQFPTAELREAKPCPETNGKPKSPVAVTLPDLSLNSGAPIKLPLQSMINRGDHDGIRFTGSLQCSSTNVDSVVLFVECFRQFKDTIQIVESSTEIVEVQSGAAKVDLVLRKPAYGGNYTVSIVAMAGQQYDAPSAVTPRCLASGPLQILEIR